MIASQSFSKCLISSIALENATTFLNGRLQPAKWKVFMILSRNMQIHCKSKQNIYLTSTCLAWCLLPHHGWYFFEVFYTIVYHVKCNQSQFGQSTFHVWILFELSMHATFKYFFLIRSVSQLILHSLFFPYFHDTHFNLIR